MGDRNKMSRYFKGCSDRKKCMFLAGFVALACLGAVFTLQFAESDLKVATNVDGVYYDNNPWTASR